ncbi:MAG: hypothetical protein PHT40_00175 [Patescibacteria group bacterium]|nr:hypothetical protein [Patescibacteria group bacterium]
MEWLAAILCLLLAFLLLCVRNTIEEKRRARNTSFGHKHSKLFLLLPKRKSILIKGKGGCDHLLTTEPNPKGSPR